MISKINLRSRYSLICIKEEDIFKIVFRTRYGNYEFIVVPFDFTNASTTFMFVMNSLLHPCLDKFFILFINDILVYSKNEEDHAKHLTIVM